MGSFQISYDDFSGGQYMGRKANNWPKNQWTGIDVIPTPDGNLIPSSPYRAGYYAPSSGITNINIFDHWVIGVDSYVFALWDGTTSRMIKTPNINNGTKFPITTSTSPGPLVATTITGVITGKVAYEPSASKFYYATSSGTIYSVLAGATPTIATVSSALSGIAITNIALYGYRLVAWGPTSKRLYYSDTTFGTWSTANYYEFNGNILNVLPRTNDLLVICDTGVFSLVGVLGSSITNQLIVPQTNVAEGMRNAVVVGRNTYFLDQSQAGSPDGRIYRLTGSSVQAVETMNIFDVVESQSKGIEQGVIGVVNDGRIIVQLRDGHCYAESIPGTWVRFYSAANQISSPYAAQVSIGRAGPSSLNEYFLVASVDMDDAGGSGKPGIELTRYIHNVASIVNKDNDFQYVSTAATSIISSQGNVTLPEYWHSKPFTVKEVFVEFYARAGYTPAITTFISPTGIIDLYTAENGSSWVEGDALLSVGTGNNSNATITQRFRANDAVKGFGIKPGLNYTDATIKRVILNSED
jgi:hypothetical protein